MREIKFKVYVEKYNIIRDVIFFDEKIVKYWDHPSKNAAQIKWYTNICSIEHSKLLQYTWLKDKYWKEIFEWDIIDYYWSILVIEFKNWRFVVKDTFWYVRCICNYLLENALIIWNIHEDPNY